MTQVWDAARYEREHGYVWRHGLSLVDDLAPKQGERVLDLGCGTGQLTNEIASRGADVLGVDAAVEMIERARRGFPNLRFEVGDARDLHCGVFDAVFSNAVLHWIPEHDRVARSVAGSLVSGGRFVAELGGHGNVRLVNAAIVQALEEQGIRDAALRKTNLYPKISVFTAHLEAAGLLVVRAELFDRPTPIDGGALGLANWYATFGKSFIAGLSSADRDRAVARAEEIARPTLWREGAWVADYVRLRVIAEKAEHTRSPRRGRA